MISDVTGPLRSTPRRLAAGAIVALVAMAATIGCAHGAPPPDGVQAAVVGTIWRWVRLVGPEPLEVAWPGRYTLDLEPGGRYAFRADCNVGGGSYTLDAGRLALGPAATTLADCGPDSLAERFTTLLGSVEGYALSDERLVLNLARGGGALAFTPQTRTSPAGLAWLVAGYNNGKRAVVSVLPGTSLTAAFAEDGTLSGSAGCNRYSASYALDGEALSTGPARVTRMACAEPEGVMEQEAAFLAALETASTYRLRSERLELRTAEGARAVDLVSAVTGTVTYHARRALPPDAEVRVRLEDVSLADAPAELLGEHVFAPRGAQVPLAFRVPFDPADLDPRHTYHVRASISEPGGRALFRTTQAFPVITRGSPQFDVEVVLDLAR